MARRHTHLSMEERERISQMLASGRSKRDIAETLGRDRSTIFRELNRNGDHKGPSGYSAVCAQRRAEVRRRQRSRVKKLDHPQTQQVIRSGLGRRWSPDQIAGRLRREHPQDRSRWVSRMTIYRWIEQQEDRA